MRLCRGPLADFDGAAVATRDACKLATTPNVYVNLLQIQTVDVRLLFAGTMFRFVCCLSLALHAAEGERGLGTLAGALLWHVDSTTSGLNAGNLGWLGVHLIM